VRPHEQFGVNLRARRLAAGWSQQELSDRCGLHLTEISRLENGRRDPRLDTIARLADALGIPAAALLAGVGPSDG
jgi:transcriptional regulator with XRE-family HTH domain